MKQSLLFILITSILIGAISLAGMHTIDAATNLNSSKSNIYRDISVQASGENSKASFEQSNINKETASENNCSGGECSISVLSNFLPFTLISTLSHKVWLISKVSC